MEEKKLRVGKVLQSHKEEGRSREDGHKGRTHLLTLGRFRTNCSLMTQLLRLQQNPHLVLLTYFPQDQWRLKSGPLREESWLEWCCGLQAGLC